MHLVLHNSNVIDFLQDLLVLKAGNSYMGFGYCDEVKDSLANAQMRTEEDAVTHHIAMSQIDRDFEIYI